MRKCPFCGAEVNFDYPHLTQFTDDNTWSFYHYCKHEEDKLGVVITIYGESKEEIIAKWDGVYYAKEQTSERL
jgi:hypothetical protein